MRILREDWEIATTGIELKENAGKLQELISWYKY